MVGNLDGIAMWQALGSGQLFVSLTAWGFGLNNDLSIVPTSPAAGPYCVIPRTQFIAGANSTAYNFYTGAFIANTGLNNQTNASLIATTTFTPTGGSPTVLAKDTMTAATINPTDSILEAISSTKRNFTPSGNGVYKIDYNLSSSVTDDNPSDNNASVSVEVSDNIFCKTPITSNGMPVTNSGLRINSSIPISWGPLVYVAKGGHRALTVRYVISDNDTSKHDLTGQVYSSAFLFKWTDGSNGGSTNGIIEARELSLKGAAVRNFTTADSPGKAFASFIGNENGQPATITLDSQSWYWVGVELPVNVFLGCHQDINYYNRSNAAKKQTTSILDFWSPLYSNSATNINSSSSDTLRMIPFGSTTAFAWNIDSAAYSSVKGSSPGVALELSPFPINVKETTVADKQVTLYPNPASEYVNVDIKLNDKAAKATVKIIDAFGRTVCAVDRTNLQSDIVRLSTSNLASGNYYVIVIADGKSLFRGFTIENK
jgi:hypothetical protein